MISQNDVIKYIENIPSLPAPVLKTYNALKISDVAAAAEFANQDLIFSKFLSDVTKKGIYAFSKPLTDIKQIFSTLGIPTSKAIIERYILNLIFPDEFLFFNCNKAEFENFIESMLKFWEFLIADLPTEEKKWTISLVSLCGAMIILTESIFKDYKNEIKKMQSVSSVEIDTILYRLTNFHVNELAKLLADNLELDSKVIEVLNYSLSFKSDIKDDDLIKIAKWFQLTLFYFITKSEYIKFGFDEIFKCDTLFAQDEIEFFMAKIEGFFDDSSC